MIRWGASLAALSVVVLSACSGPEVVYYTLSPSDKRVSPTSGNWDLPYRIGSVTVPAQVNDTALVVRLSSDRMMVLGQDRWSASLNEQFRDALVQSLTQQLGMPPVQNLVPSSKDITQVSVDVQRFELLPGDRAVLAAAWSIDNLPTTKGRLAGRVTCYSQLETPSEVGVAALVKAQQDNLVKLTRQIADVMRTAGTGQLTAAEQTAGCYKS